MNNDKINLLVVDDDAGNRHALRTTLTALGFALEEASDAQDAIRMVGKRCPDVILLDVNMPGLNGFEACRELREMCPGAGIVMLTVRDAREDKIQGLEAGADDFVSKPFDVGELRARIRAVARRSSLPRGVSSPIRVGEFHLDPVERTVTKAGRRIHLTPKEFDLLHVLVSRVGLLVSHADLLRAVWGPKHRGDLEYIRTFVNQLRKKIEDDPAHPAYLVTQPFIGYRFRLPEPEVDAIDR